MMDKIVVTAADIEKLLAWRDEHNDLVRSMPVPLREVEIQIVESGISIKCFRSDKKLKLYLDSPARKLGHVVFAPLGNGLWKKKVSTLPADCNPAETEQGALTVYGSLMALMTYGAGSIRGGVATTTSKAPAERKSSTKPNTASTTYIIHSAGKQLTVVPRGHHASPACSFTVRGHFRHYKSGKTVWIAEYSKGTGRSRGKTYKIGGDLDGSSSLITSRMTRQTFATPSVAVSSWPCGLRTVCTTTCALIRRCTMQRFLICGLPFHLSGGVPCASSASVSSIIG